MAEAVVAYDLLVDNHSCEGWSYGGDFVEYVQTRVKDRCTDDAGTRDLVERVQGVETAGFDPARLTEILATEPPDEPGKIGECIAECFLEDHKEASLPNPRRTLKNPRASPAGADLVGVSKEEGGMLFLFGEVKTTRVNRSPPPVMNKMISQLEKITSSKIDRNNMIRWLAFQTEGSDLWGAFCEAVCNYSKSRYRVVGALIRDTKPQKDDISSACSKIRRQIGSGTLLALYALYLPIGIERLNEILAGRSGG